MSNRINTHTIDNVGYHLLRGTQRIADNGGGYISDAIDMKKLYDTQVMCFLPTGVTDMANLFQNSRLTGNVI
jgi:hypothetical protein